MLRQDARALRLQPVPVRKVPGEASKLKPDVRKESLSVDDTAGSVRFPPGADLQRWVSSVRFRPLERVEIGNSSGDRHDTTEGKRPLAIAAPSVPPRAIAVNSPRSFVVRMAGRSKHPLGDFFGLANFGVNLTRLASDAVSALRHAHSLQEEFI
jgi:hypothetical protein